MLEDLPIYNSYLKLHELHREMQNLEDQAFMDLVTERIKAAIQPYDPGAVTFFVNNHINDGAVLIVEVERLHWWPFAYAVDRELLCQMFHPEDQLRHIAEEAYRWYKYRPANVIDDHIILGSD